MIWEVYCAFAGGYDIKFGHKKKLLRHVLHSSSGVSCSLGNAQCLISTSFVLPNASRSQSTNYSANSQQKPKHAICSVYTLLLTKGLLHKHINTQPQASTHPKGHLGIFIVLMHEIMTVNLVQSGHLQSGVKTSTLTDYKTVRINLLVTKHSTVMSLLQQFLVRHRRDILLILEQVSQIRNISSFLIFTFKAGRQSH